MTPEISFYAYMDWLAARKLHGFLGDGDAASAPPPYPAQLDVAICAYAEIFLPMSSSQRENGLRGYADAVGNRADCTRLFGGPRALPGKLGYITA